MYSNIFGWLIIDVYLQPGLSLIHVNLPDPTGIVCVILTRVLCSFMAHPLY